MAGIVTISASYGAHGYKIGRAVAGQLDLPFIDRAVPTAAVASQLQLPEDVVESIDERVPSRWERLATAFVGVATPVSATAPSAAVAVTPEQFRSAAEDDLRAAVDPSGAVVLGRAAMVILGGRPDVLCVRLDGPVDARIAQVVADGVDEAKARQGQAEVDRAREAYARVFFNARQGDPTLYHVVLDSTALSVAACTDIIVRAAKERFDRASGEAGPT